MDNLEPITRNEMFLNSDDLEPITREEMILAGADLEPITRHEWFLKKYRGGGGGGGYDLVNIPNLPADIASFNDGTDLPMASLKVAVTPYQDLSHGDPSPSNICPIIGWDEANVTRTGKNQAKKTIHGYINYQNSKMVIDNDSESVVFYAVAGKTYTVSSSVTLNRSMLGLADTDNITNLYQLLDIIELSNESVTWTATWTGWTVWYKCTSAQSGFANSVQVELGSTATTYEPYNGSTYTIDLNGTRYGGTLDATNGTMDDTLDHIASYNGEALPSTWISDRDVYAEGTTPTIGAEVVYTRATPISVQLAPQPVKSLEGTNNIFANCGQITEVKYFKKA